MIRKLIIALGLALSMPAAAHAAGEAKHPHKQDWSFNGPFGKFDRGQLQRGLQVYKEVCASCHAMEQLTYRNLGERGGPLEAVAVHGEDGSVEYHIGVGGHGGKPVSPIDNPYVKAIAADYSVDTIDPQTGDTITRKAIPSDKFHKPFPSEGAARGANGGALPPDMSVLSKARRGGPDYISALIGHGYETPPEGLEVPPGKYYNSYLHGDLSSFWKGDPKHVPPGGLIAMPPQLTPDRVTYADGTAATVDQMSKDVAAFLAWTADTKQEERKALGFQVMAYLLLLTVLVYLAYRQVWAGTKH
jgi:ubiquinol-cytochrome c reductase cytochrome c1 subunit